MLSKSERLDIIDVSGYNYKGVQLVRVTAMYPAHDVGFTTYFTFMIPVSKRISESKVTTSHNMYYKYI